MPALWKALPIAVIGLGFVLAGCTEGSDNTVEMEGATAAQKAPYEPSSVQGAAGGERNDQTSPVAPASSTAGGDTSSAFPNTAPPSNRPPSGGSESASTESSAG